MLKTLLGATALAALALPALAQTDAMPDVGAIRSDDHRLTLRTRTAATRPTLTLSRHDPALGTVIHTNLGGAEDRYLDYIGWSVDSAQISAMPFTPALPARVGKVIIALSHITGLNAMTVGLHEDKGGLPGKRLKRLSLDDMPPFGECCVTMSAGFGGVPVEAGRVYWLVAQTTKGSDTWAAWNLNSTGAVGLTAYRDMDGWHLADGQPGAFEVRGR